MMGGGVQKIRYRQFRGSKMTKNCRRLLWMAPMSKMKRTLFFGRHGILIFSCLLFVLFEKTKPDVFVLSLSLCYTMASLGNYCSKIICLQKKVEMGQKNILLSCECWQTFVLILLLTLQMFTGVYRVIKGFFCKICRENPIIKIKFPCNL